MRAWEMHPLCCLAGEWPASGGGHAPPEPAAEGEAPTVAGVLYKWTNIGKGWRPRWFAIRGGVLAYLKIRRRVVAEPHPAPKAAAADGIRLIGVVRGSAGERPIGFVHLKVQPLITLFGFLNKGIKLRSERCQKISLYTRGEGRFGYKQEMASRGKRALVRREGIHPF